MSPGFVFFLAENPGFEDELCWLRCWPSLPVPRPYRCLTSGSIRPSANFEPELVRAPGVASLGFQGIATSLVGDRQ